jgi:hypothetical protein
LSFGTRKEIPVGIHLPAGVFLFKYIVDDILVVWFPATAGEAVYFLFGIRKKGIDISD